MEGLGEEDFKGKEMIRQPYYSRPPPATATATATAAVVVVVVVVVGVLVVVDSQRETRVVGGAAAAAVAAGVLTVTILRESSKGITACPHSSSAVSPAPGMDTAVAATAAQWLLLL